MKFAELGGNAICIIGLGGWTHLTLVLYCSLIQESVVKVMKQTQHRYLTASGYTLFSICHRCFYFISVLNIIFALVSVYLVPLISSFQSYPPKTVLYFIVVGGGEQPSRGMPDGAMPSGVKATG